MELWQPVVGYECCYSVSDRGRVRNARTGRILRTQRKNGRPRVHFSIDGHRSPAYLVSRLVLTAFVGPCPPGMNACHYDDVPTHNHLSNLRWDTPSANTHDKIRNGHYRPARCGTEAGYSRHRNLKERPCIDCTTAHSKAGARRAGRL